MKKVRGIVLESTLREVILLCRGGEYRRLPARGRLYPLGMEMEVAPSLLPVRTARFPAIAAAAAIFLLLGTFSLFWAFGTARTAAHLAVDINPSLLLILDQDAAVIDAEAYNKEGELLLGTLELENQPAKTAVQLIIREAYQGGFLAAGRENVVMISLAAPPRFAVNEAALQQAAAKQLYGLEVDAYLHVSAAPPQAARGARRKGVSMNAVLLAEKIAGMGPLLPPQQVPPQAQERGVGDERRRGAAAPPASVRELLKEVRPQYLFPENEFIAGEKRRRDARVNEQGAPMPAPAVHADDRERGNRKDREAKPDSLQQRENGQGQPPVTPPGLIKERDVRKESEPPPAGNANGAGAEGRGAEQPPQGKPGAGPERPGVPAGRDGDADSRSPAAGAPPEGYVPPAGNEQAGDVSPPVNAPTGEQPAAGR